MSESNIFDKIIVEKRAEGEEILKGFARKAEEFSVSERGLIDKDIQTRLVKGKKLILEKYAQQLSAVKIEERGKVHNKRYKLIDNVFLEFVKEQTQGDNYLRIFSNLLKKYGKTGDKIYVSSSEKDIIKTKIIPSSGLDISILDKPLRGRGFTIDRGDFDINCTVSQFEQKIRGYADGLQKVLFI